MTESLSTQALNEVIQEDLEALNELIAEEIEPILKETRQLRNAAFNKRYNALKKLEEEVK